MREGDIPATLFVTVVIEIIHMACTLWHLIALNFFTNLYECCLKKTMHLCSMFDFVSLGQ